jgi:phosphate transport system substrate-binding protein
MNSQADPSPEHARDAQPGFQWTEVATAIGTVAGVPIALFTTINYLAENPYVATFVALVAAVAASIWIVQTERASTMEVIIGWLSLVVVMLSVMVAWPKTMRVEGTIEYQGGGPADGIVVRLYDENNLVYEDETDADGHYAFEKVPTGPYRLQVGNTEQRGETSGILVRRATMDLRIPGVPTATATPTTPKDPTATPSATPSATLSATATETFGTPQPSEDAVAVISPISLTWQTVQRCGIAITTGAQATGAFYTIRAGDTLSRIAQEIYGRPVDYKAIYYYNNQNPETVTIEDPSRISTGWEIYLPTAEEVEQFWTGKLASLPAIAWETWPAMRAIGSSTVFPLTTRLAECFVAQADQKGYPNTMTIESIGTFEGLEAFCAGGADVLDASVRIDAQDLAKYNCGDVNLVEFRVGTDAVSIVVSRQSDFIFADTSITMDELRAILSTAKTWSEVRSAWPEEAIQRFYPSEKSGTLEFAAELLFDGNRAALLDAPNVRSSEDDAALAAKIADDPHAVGFFGYAYYQARTDTLQALPVEGKRPGPEEPDSPDPYPLIRPLFIYTTPEILAQKPGVAAYVNFYLREVHKQVVDVGYFPPSERDYEQNFTAFNEAVP